MTLSEQQIQFFEVFGYLAFPGLMADRIAAITTAFEAIWAAQGGGHHGRPHDHQQRSCIAQFIDHSEYLSSLLDDDRILGIGTSLLGDDFNYMASDGNYYAGDTPWHSDGWRTNGVRHIKMAFYLDPVGANSGCLRVIPGSHHTEDHFAQLLQEQIGKSPELWGIAGSAVPALGEHFCGRRDGRDGRRPAPPDDRALGGRSLLPARASGRRPGDDRVA